MDSELVAAYVVLASSLLALALCAGLFVWIVTGTKQSSPSRPPVSPLQWPWSLQWLIILTTATACLLSVQAVLGVSIGALALLADLAHGAADFATFTLATFVEYFKFRFGAEALNARVPTHLDRASAGFNILVVMATSICVCAEATRRLTTAKQGEVVENGLGCSMMVVAGLGMALNCFLLALREWMQKDEERRLQDCPPISSQCSDCQDPSLFSIPEDRAVNMRESLHAAFHPGCLKYGEEAHCALQNSDNLNLCAVVLHIATDVARTLLMFVAGTLVRAGVFANSAAVDAICSCLIAGCVTLGSMWLLRLACRGQQPIETLAASATKGKVSYGAA